MPIGLFALYQWLDDKGVMASQTQCPGHMYVLQSHCKGISDFREHELAWAQPPFWWTIRRQRAAHVYMTPYFAFEGRGRDGDHYLLIEERETGQVFVYFQNNF